MAMFEVLTAEQASLIRTSGAFPGAAWIFWEVIQRSSFWEGRRFTVRSFPPKPVQVLSTSAERAVCYFSCVLTIFVLFHMICAPRTAMRSRCIRGRGLQEHTCLPGPTQKGSPASFPADKWHKEIMCRNNDHKRSRGRGRNR